MGWTLRWQFTSFIQFHIYGCCEVKHVYIPFFKINRIFYTQTLNVLTKLHILLCRVLLVSTLFAYGNMTTTLKQTYKLTSYLYFASSELYK